MTTINLETILKLQPCQDRLDNYIKYYSDKEFTPRQFMGLKHITHEDKIWVAIRLMPAADATYAAAYAASCSVDAIRLSNNPIIAIANQEKRIRTIILKYWK